MRAASYISKIINNFYYRNGIILSILVVSGLAASIAFYGFEINEIVGYILNFSIFYLLLIFHNKIIYPRYFLKKKYTLYIFHTLLFTLIQLLFSRGIKMVAHTYIYPDTLGIWLSFLFNNLVLIYISLGIYLSFSYFKEREETLSLTYLKRELELKQLKEQLSPHFLFNALNNIYSYSLEKDQYSSHLLLKLSDLTGFVLKASDNDSIELHEELDFIDNYISFEKERLGSRCSVTFTRSIEDDAIHIAPFILFVFIENAFKHGSASIADFYVNIDLQADHSSVSFIVSNSASSIAGESTRIGLANAKRRLELLYPKKHKLSITHSPDTFRVVLKIDLRTTSLYTS